MKLETKMRLQTKKAEIVICAINAFLIIFMIVYLIHAFYGRKEGVSSVSDDAAALTASASEVDDALTNVYVALIANTVVSLGNDKCMYFGNDGNFDGFFDESNPDVSGYSYEVVSMSDSNDEDGAVAAVNIYNGDKTKYVQYKMVYGGSSDSPELRLLYPRTGASFAIEV